MSFMILFGGFAQTLYGMVLFLTSLFLILLVLVQRGRGGGLSGAFGGMGGQSAFGAKAGDTFTKITIGAAAFWIVLCLVGVKYMGGQAVASKFVDPVSRMDDSGDVPAEAEDGFGVGGDAANDAGSSPAAGDAGTANNDSAAGTDSEDGP